MIQPHVVRSSSSAELVERWRNRPRSSKEVMNGEMLCGSSGETGPMGDQFWVNWVVMLGIWDDGGMEKRRERELAS